MSKPVDKPFLIALIILISVGFFIFSSASLGLLTKGESQYSSVAFSQVFFGLFFGTIALIATSRIPYRFWSKHAFLILIFSLGLNLLVFAPKIGFEHGGAHRWLMLHGYSFQPSELLKCSFIIFLAAWLSGIKDRVKSLRYGFVPLVIFLAIIGLVLLAQPDTDTYLVIVFSGLSMFLVAGGQWKHVLSLILVLCIGIFVVASFRPYIKERLMTFVNPAANSETSGYQIQQSLIAIGSGEITGRGFGQSIQKFDFLPEPIGDSIFAVAAEEFGFIGSSLLILLFVFFSFRGLKIATRTPDSFGRLFIVGTVILIVSQAFINIGAMMGVLPLSGIPLPFVSHGGSALLITLAQVGIVLNISRQKK